MRKWTVLFLFYILGLSILSFGVSLSIKADLGAGAWDALNVGLYQKVGLTVGSWVIIVGVILIISNAIIGKKRPDVLAFLTIALLGPMIDFWLLLVMGEWVLNTFLLKLFTLMMGILIISIGVSLYLQPKFPLIPIDGFMVALQKRFNLGIIKAKTITEIIALFLALAFGGPIGIGTILILLMIGPTIQFFEPKAQKVMVHMIGQ